YLRHITGDWLAWQHAQQDYWGRSWTWPWKAFSTTWDAAGASGQGAACAWSFRAEIAAVIIGLLLTVLLLVRRRWAEEVYIGGLMVALGTSSFYLSVARASLLWWPLWVLLAGWSMRRRWLQVAYLSVAPALMVVAVIGFNQGHWIG